MPARHHNMHKTDKERFKTSLSRNKTYWAFRKAALIAQEGKCAICGASFNDLDDARTNPKSPASICVDHDHETGKLRALLCIACNTGLGHFYDSPERLEKAALYLRYHK